MKLCALFGAASEMVVQTETGKVVMVTSNAPSPTAAEPLIPCGICDRSFAASRVDKHRVACEKASKKRETFDMRDKRLDVFKPEELNDAKRLGKEIEKKMQRVAKKGWRDQRAQLLAGIAPNSAAAAEMKPPEDDRVECAGCGRKFGFDAWDRHHAKCEEKARLKR